MERLLSWRYLDKNGGRGFRESVNVGFIGQSNLSLAFSCGGRLLGSIGTLLKHWGKKNTSILEGDFRPTVAVCSVKPTEPTIQASNCSVLTDVCICVCVCQCVRVGVFCWLTIRQPYGNVTE